MTYDYWLDWLLSSQKSKHRGAVVYTIHVVNVARKFPRLYVQGRGRSVARLCGLQVTQ